MEVGRKMVNVVGNEAPDLINFEETELRLGLPGGRESNGDHMKRNNNNNNNTNSNGKREFDVSVDLKLKLSSKEMGIDPNDLKMNNSKPPSKAQVVGWPPVRSFRKNIMAVQKSSTNEEDAKVNGNATFVKVSLDGAPYLRKVDLNMYKSYQELSDALAKMFSSFTIGNCGSQGIKDFLNESKLRDILSGSDYVPTYEDKDADWMLVGDVPWEMFVGSCKRLRIMKGAEAKGLAPRAMEKCKNRC